MNKEPVMSRAAQAMTTGILAAENRDVGSRHPESALGHSLQIVARWKSVHVCNAPKATVGCQKVVRRDGPCADIRFLCAHV